MLQILILLLYFFAAGFSTTSAQTKEIYLEELSVNDGLPGRWANDIDQDSQGYLWIATDYGFCRYDGYEFEYFMSSNEDTTGLRSNFINKLLVDSDDNIWLGTEETGLYMYEQASNSFFNLSTDSTRKNYISSNRVYTLWEDNEGNIWTITDNELNKIDKYTLEVDRYSYVNEEGPIYEFIPYRNKLFVLKPSYDLIIFDAETLKFNEPEIVCEKNEAATTLFIENDFLFVGGSKGGIYKYRILDDSLSDVLEFHQIPGGTTNRINKIFRYSEDNLWIGTEEGLFALNTETKGIVKLVSSVKDQASIEYETISEIYRDRENSIWIGTARTGFRQFNEYFNQFNPTSFESLGLKGVNEISRVLVDSDGEIWIGTDNGLYRKQPDGKTIYYKATRLSPNSYNCQLVVHLFEDSKGRIWIGSASEGISIYDKKNDSFKSLYRSNTDGGLKSNAVVNIVEDFDGDYWIATVGGGLLKYNEIKNEWTQFTTDQSDSTQILDSSVMELNIDSEGNIWAGMYSNGLSIYDVSENKIYNYSHDPADSSSISSGGIFSIFFDSRGNSWLGMRSSGLIKFDREKNKFVRFTEAEGITTSTVFDINEDNEGYIVLMTSEGLMLYDAGIKQFYNFNESSTFSKSNPTSYFWNDNGVFYVGSMNGLMKFDPAKLIRYSYGFDPVFTNYQYINDENSEKNGYSEIIRLYTPAEIKISSSTILFEIEYSALSFVIPENLKYAYLLEGYHKNWVRTNGEERSATFTNLDPGDYTFTVAVLNDDGSISTNQRSLALIVTPVFTQTYWFYALILIAVIGFIYWIYRLRINKIYELEKLRLKIASDLHDEVGSTLTKVSMRAQMLEMQINGEKESKNLQRISEQAREAVSTMQDIVWAIDSRNDEAECLINKMKDTAFSTLAEKNIKVDFEVNGLDKEEKLSLNLRQNVYLIMKEAVHNITKHSNAKNVKIRLNNAPEKFEMEIRDDGNNFRLSEYVLGQGLKNMQMRGKKIGGEVLYKNENGFTVVLTSPPLN